MILMNVSHVVLEMLIYLAGLERLGLLPKVELQPFDSHHPPAFDDIYGMDTQNSFSQCTLFTMFTHSDIMWKSSGQAAHFTSRL